MFICAIYVLAYITLSFDNKDLKKKKILFRKLTWEGVFPEDVAVAVVAAVTKTVQRVEQNISTDFWVCFSFIWASLEAVTMISLSDSQSKNVYARKCLNVYTGFSCSCWLTVPSM